LPGWFLESPDEALGPTSSAPQQGGNQVSMTDPVVTGSAKPKPDLDPAKYSLTSFISDVGKHNGIVNDAFKHLYGGGFGAIA
jgi:hypothetical protein